MAPPSEPKLSVGTTSQAEAPGLVARRPAVWRRALAARPRRPKRRTPRLSRKGRLRLLLLLILLAAMLGILAHWEARSSQLQSYYFAKQAAQLGFKVEPGPSDSFAPPPSGPFDQRLGYALLPGLLERLLARGYEVEAQARNSPQHLSLMRKGIYPIYHEKSQAGLTVLDHQGRAVFMARHPQLVYQSFEEIPSIIVRTLLYIEDRDLLDERFPNRNPTVEWDRLARAVLDMVISKILPGHDVPGGSTLATQIEKYRHSPEGRTSSAKDKLIQMASATYRAYLDGRSTAAARRRVVRDYVNSVPLGAIPGAGEVRGLGHALGAWHGASFKQTNELLKDGEPLDADPATIKAKAQAYKEVLSLFLAQRRPAYYLQTNRDALEALIDRHMGGLARAGIISEAFRREVQAHDLTFRNNMIVYQPERLDFIERKAANAVRVHLLSLFGFDRLYSLDRLDLEATSTLDYDAQKAVTDVLAKLKDKDFAAESGLLGERLLARGDPSEVVYSFTLRERVGSASVLRVQADNVDGPFNVSEGGKLELGSTAKLRTLVTYLEVVEGIWAKHRKQAAAELAQVEAGLHPSDALGRWALAWLRATQGEGRTLRNMLQSAMDRPYSASPAEPFFTGGGLHRFSNFAPEDNDRVVTVTQALEKSINLPFIRMMRDIVDHYVGQIPGSYAMLQDFDDPQRKQYLGRFANKEGRQFLGRFYLKYRDLDKDGMVRALLAKFRATPRRLAAVFSVLEPSATPDGLQSFLVRHLPGEKTSDKLAASLHEEMHSDRYNLHDKGYIASIHPLELWLVAYLYRVPKPSFSQVMDASATQRQEVYDWLFNSKKKARQDVRIRIMLEQEAFQTIHAQWQKLGYPFASLVPTLATALGSSGDKPAALAELIGIIGAGGMRYPAARIEALHFAAGTPFETRLRAKHAPGTRVLDEDVAAVLRDALTRVVDHGTAIRVKGAFTHESGTPIPVGGKTGTGDNRYSIFAPGGRVIESKVMSRTATFVFFIGERFFGTVTAYVPSANAGNYNFTSALPTQILKILAPRIAPLIARAEASAKP